MRPVTIGLLTTTSDFGITLRAQLKGTGLGTIVVEVPEHCRTRTDSYTRKFIDARPEIILINAEDVPASLTSIQVLHGVLPAAWILVCTSASDSDTILKVVRAGAREVAPLPLTSDSLTQALRRYIEEQDREKKDDSNVGGKIYSVCAAKRGSGATTMSINVAASLVDSQDARVALIDMDWPLGDAAGFLNIRPRFTIADALASASRLDSVLLESYTHQHEGFHVLAGLEDFGTGEVLDATSVSQLLEAVTHTYTHAVLDLPLSLPRNLLLTALGMSSAIVAVLTPDLPSLRRTERLLRFLSASGMVDKVRLVLNRYRRSDEITDVDIEKSLHRPVACKVANDYNACMEAINSGKAVHPSLSKHLARDFRNVARNLEGQEDEGKRRGILNLLPRTSY